MGKKELKRDLKLYKSDLNSMADESIYYKECAEKAEAMVERLIAAHYEDSRKWVALRNEWRANPPKPYRAEAAQ